MTLESQSLNLNARQILIKRLSSVQALAYTGPLGELILDTTLKLLRIQDGVTPGGILVTSADYLANQVANVQSQLNFIKSNIDPAALDSLTEILANVNALLSNNVESQLFNSGNYANLAANGDLIISGELLPRTHLMQDLGSPTAAWANLYVGASTIYFGTIPVSVTSNGLTVGDASNKLPLYGNVRFEDGTLQTTAYNPAYLQQLQYLVTPPVANNLVTIYNTIDKGLISNVAVLQANVAVLEEQVHIVNPLGIRKNYINDVNGNTLGGVTNANRTTIAFASYQERNAAINITANASTTNTEINSQVILLGTVTGTIEVGQAVYKMTPTPTLIGEVGTQLTASAYNLDVLGLDPNVTIAPGTRLEFYRSGFVEYGTRVPMQIIWNSGNVTLITSTSTNNPFSTQLTLHTAENQTSLTYPIIVETMIYEPSYREHVFSSGQRITSRYGNLNVYGGTTDINLFTNNHQVNLLRTGNLVIPGTILSNSKITISNHLSTSSVDLELRAAGDLLFYGDNITFDGVGSMSGNLTVNDYIKVQSGIIATGASPAPYISGFSSISTVGSSGNITASGYLVAARGMSTLGNINLNNMINFSSGALVDTSDNNVEIRGMNNFNIESRNVVNIYTDTQNNGYQWQFDDNGDLRVPNNLRISSVEQVGENVGPYNTDIYGNYVGGQTDAGFSTAINLGNSVHDDLFNPPVPNFSTTTGSIAANGDFTPGSSTGTFDMGTVIEVNGQVLGDLRLRDQNDPGAGFTLAVIGGSYNGPVVNSGTLIQGYNGWITRSPRTTTYIKWADGTSTQVTGSQVNQYPQSLTGFLFTATNVSTKPFPITIYTANYVPAKIGAGANNNQLFFTADGDLTVPNQIFVRTGIKAEVAVSPAPYISGFSSISTAGNPGNITASGYLVASQGIHTTGNITVGKNIYGSYRSGISNAIQFRPNIAVDKRFLFTVDSINGGYVRSGLEMPSAEIDKAVTLAFPHTNSNAGFIYIQGSDSGATEFNDAFNIMMNSGNVKISALSYAGGNRVWTFDTNGNLTLPQTAMNVSPAPTSLPGITWTDGTFQTGKTIELPDNQIFELRFKSSIHGPVEYGNLKIDRSRVTTSNQGFSVAFADGNYFSFNSSQKRIERSDSNGLIIFGTETRNSTGDINDIEIKSYGDGTNGNVYIAAGGNPTSTRWAFQQNAKILFPDASQQSTAWTGAAARVQSAPPASPVTGQMYYDTDDGNTYIWTGAAWIDSHPSAAPNNISTGNITNGTSFTAYGITVSLTGVYPGPYNVRVAVAGSVGGDTYISSTAYTGGISTTPTTIATFADPGQSTTVLISDMNELTMFRVTVQMVSNVNMNEVTLVVIEKLKNG